MGIVVQLPVRPADPTRALIREIVEALKVAEAEGAVAAAALEAGVELGRMVPAS